MLKNSVGVKVVCIINYFYDTDGHYWQHLCHGVKEYKQTLMEPAVGHCRAGNKNSQHGASESACVRHGESEDDVTNVNCFLRRAVV